MFPLGCRCFAGLILAATITVAAGTASGQSSDIEREWRLVQQAQSAHDRGRAASDRGDRATADSELGTAASLYRQLLEQYPLRRDLYAPLADTLIRRENPAAAYAMLIQQVRSGNRERGVALQLVRALLAIRQSHRAFEEAQKLAKSDPKSAVVQALLGEAAADAGELNTAIAALTQALAQPQQKAQLAEVNLDPTALRLHQARLLLAAHRFAEVAAAVKPLTDAEQPEALLLLGQAQLEMAQLGPAVVTLRRCLAAPSSKPQQSRATALLAQALSRSGQTTEAIAVLRRAGDDPTVLLALADLYLKDQPPSPQAALMVVDRAAQVAPTDQRVCLEHASLLERNQKTASALQTLSRCSGLTAPTGEGSQETLLLRAEVELRLGRIDDGIASLRSARALPGAAAELKLKLAKALLRRGLQRLDAPPPGSETAPPSPTAAGLPLADFVEAGQLAPSPTLSWATGLGLLAVGKTTDALSLLLPLCEKSPTDARLLAACGRTLRDGGQLSQALAMLQRAATLVAQPSPNPPPAGLRTALQKEQATTLIALHRPLDALKLLDGQDAEAQQARAQLLLSIVRAFYLPSPGGPPAAGGTTAGGRGPFPPLRGPTEQPQLRVALSQGAATRGPFPPLRNASDHPELTQSNLGSASPQGLSDERQVLHYAQLALRTGTLSVSERAEAMLYQVAALVHGGQPDIAQRLLGEIASKFDLATLTSLLGPGGFADLKARLALRGGDFYQGVSTAQQALPQLKPAAARSLQTTMAAAYTSKAIELIERNEVDRANSLLRAAWTQTQGGPPENLARANYNLAVLQLHRGKLEDARTALSRLDPQLLPEVWLGLGSYYDQRSDGRAALDAYRHYLQLSGPGDPQLPRVRQWVDVLERIYEGSQP